MSTESVDACRLVDVVEVGGVSVTTSAGLCPFREEPVRLWAGNIKLDATNLDLSLPFRVRVSCKKKYRAMWKCKRGHGTLQKGDLHFIHLVLPEMAIYSSTVRLFVGDQELSVVLFKLPKADEFYWGFNTSDAPEPSPVSVGTAAHLTPSPTISTPFDRTHHSSDRGSALSQPATASNRGSFVLQQATPFLGNLPNGLRQYIEGSTTNSTLRDQLFAIVHPVTLQVLAELGNHASRELQAPAGRTPNSGAQGQAKENGKDLVELILDRVAEKLREPRK